MQEIPLTPPPDLQRFIHRQLVECADGIQEIELIRALQTHMPDLISKDVFSDSLYLFRVHFILFNSLYDLRAKLSAQQTGILDIGQLKITLHPWISKSSAEVTHHDALHEYYLNYDNLLGTDRIEVEQMLGRFWKRYHSLESKPAAMKVLQLSENSDWSAIRKQYQKLSMQYHPDRGGDKLAYQKINEAYEVLKKSPR